MEQPWRVEMLGRLRAVRGHRIVERFRTQKTASLLAYLAYHLGREHPRDELIEVLWPEDDRDAARHKLSVALSSLRAQLEPPGIADGSVLTTRRLTAGLNADAVTTDVAELERGFRAAACAPAEPERIEALSAAVDRYAGKLLPSLYEEWIFPEQERLIELALQALRELVDSSERAGNLQWARRYALRGLWIDSEREELHDRVIQLCEESGRPAAAARHRAALARLKVGMTLSESVRAGRAAGRPPREATDSPLEPEMHLEPVGGAIPLDSQFYVQRAADRELRAAVARRDSIVLLKGAAQTGKSSLLARVLQQAREEGARVMRTEFHTLNGSRLASAEVLLNTLAQAISEQLDLSGDPADAMAGLGGPNIAFRRFLKRDVLGPLTVPVVWAIDGIDRLFACSFGEEIFELFRSLHNERAFDPEGPWQELTLVIAYATEAHLFISDPNRSPFNVGTRLQIEDFSREQVEELNARYSTPLRGPELARLFGLLDGHPYLLRRALNELTTQRYPLRALEQQAAREDGPFGDHLRRIRALLEQDLAPARAVRAVLQGDPVEPAVFYRLRSAGVLKGESPANPRMRCQLYERYFRSCWI